MFQSTITFHGHKMFSLYQNVDLKKKTEFACRQGVFPTLRAHAGIGGHDLWLGDTYIHSGLLYRHGHRYQQIFLQNKFSLTCGAQFSKMQWRHKKYTFPLILSGRNGIICVSLRGHRVTCSPRDPNLWSKS